jgi:hypothetical protein
MKKVLITGLFLSTAASPVFAQKYMTRTGKIFFTATAAHSPEKIEGVNNEVANILDSKSGDIVFQVLVKSFKFERELMKEHFNENYMESDKFPKSEFKGTVTNIAEVNFAKDGTYNVKVTGKLSIHGVTNDITVPGTITVKGSSVTAKAKFPVALKDYKIDIPSLVADKIDKIASISLESELSKR